MKIKKMKKQNKYIDDQHTIYDMDVEGLKNRKKPKLSLTIKERLALIFAAIAKFFPQLLLIILCFGIAMLLIYLWLR